MLLAAADQAFADCLSGVAGELRGPLRSVLKLARLLAGHDGALDAGTREYADYIRANTEHMAVMFDNLKRQAAPRATADESRRSWQPVETR